MDYYSESDKGKCISCGYLAKHCVGPILNMPTPRFYEIDPLDRKEGDDYRIFFRHDRIPTDVVCFVHAADLVDGLRDFTNEKDEERVEKLNQALEALNRDRKCPKWCLHMPGFDPMDHYSWSREKEIEDGRRIFEERLSKAARDAQQALADREAESQTKTSNLMTRLTLLAIGIAVVQILTGLTKDNLVAKAVVRLWHSLFG